MEQNSPTNLKNSSEVNFYVEGWMNFFFYTPLSEKSPGTCIRDYRCCMKNSNVVCMMYWHSKHVCRLIYGSNYGAHISPYQVVSDNGDYPLCFNYLGQGKCESKICPHGMLA